MATSKNTNLLPPVRPRLICLDTVDSTNNYAMQRIDAGLAAQGDAVLAARQTAGKGQRGKSWQDAPEESLLMSLILSPGVDLNAQPLFLAAVAVAAAELVQQYAPQQKVTIKWPNDIMIADKKAGGILIENVVRGSAWPWAVVGMGLNVMQPSFPVELPHAISLRMAGADAINLENLASELANAVLEKLENLADGKIVLDNYNGWLHGIGEWQAFGLAGSVIQRKILGMDSTGMLQLEDESGRIAAHAHGSIEWIWR